MITYDEIGTNTNITLADFKAYANITGTDKDTQLQDVLTQATLRVQEYADRALLPCTIIIEVEGEQAQLWQPIISAITKVVDMNTGDDVVADCMAKGNTLYFPRPGAWKVTYTTQPSSGDVKRLLAYVWEMAAAMWDGNTEEEAKVYQRIPADYVVQ
jgi:hypothetical protein